MVADSFRTRPESAETVTQAEREAARKGLHICHFLYLSFPIYLFFKILFYLSISLETVAV